MKRNLIKGLGAIFLVMTFIVGSGFVIPACDRTKTIDDFASTSREMAHDVELAIDTTKILYTNGRVSLELKDKLADLYGEVSRRGKIFNDLVISLSQQEKAGTLPTNALQLLRENWILVFQVWQDIHSLTSTTSTLNGSNKQLAEDVRKIDSAITRAGNFSSLKR